MTDAERLVVSRFTTRYNPSQDRIQLALAFNDVDPIGAWLTQRLAKRLAATLIGLLDNEKIRLSHNASEVHSIAQQHARQVVNTQAPQADVFATRESLIEAIDLDQKAKSVVMTFRCENKGSYILTIGSNQLRGWLSILSGIFTNAEWDISVFPAWIREPSATTQTAVLH